MGAPPFLELKKPLALRIDFRPQVVILGPVCIGRVQVLEIAHQVAAVERAVPQVARQRRHPAAARHATGVPHGIDTLAPGPIGKRRTRQDHRPEKLRARGRDHHGRPAGLAVADHTGFALRLRVQRDDLLHEDRLGMHDVFQSLAGLWLRREADEVTRMARAHRHADLAVALESADPGPVACARIDHHEGTHGRVGLDPWRRNDAHQSVVHGACKRAAIDDEFSLKLQDMGHGLGLLLEILIAAPADDVPEQNRALTGVDHVLGKEARVWQGCHGIAGISCSLAAPGRHARCGGTCFGGSGRHDALRLNAGRPRLAAHRHGFNLTR